MNTRRTPSDKTLFQKIRENLDILFFVIIGALGLVLAIYTFIQTPTDSPTQSFFDRFISGFGVDFSLELLSIAFTVSVIDRLIVRPREKRESLARERLSELNRLIDILRPESHSRKFDVIDELHSDEYLTSGEMRGIYLRDVDMSGTELNNANFEECNLINANLSDAVLDGANLQRARLREANLQNAHLPKADLRGANLMGANLKNAQLRGCNIEKVILTNADLTNADLTGANLKNAQLRGCNIEKVTTDTATILPDGSRCNTIADLEKFI